MEKGELGEWGKEDEVSIRIKTKEKIFHLTEDKNGELMGGKMK